MLPNTVNWAVDSAPFIFTLLLNIPSAAVTSPLNVPSVVLNVPVVLIPLAVICPLALILPSTVNRSPGFVDVPFASSLINTFPKSFI